MQEYLEFLGVFTWGQDEIGNLHGKSALSLATVRVCHNVTMSQCPNTIPAPVLDRPPVASPFHHFSMLNLKPSPCDMCRQGQVQSLGRRLKTIFE